MADTGRSAVKRTAIVDAATTLFLRSGYQGTSVDQIAALASVSKQTVYKNFGDKERLFSDVVLGVTASAEQFAEELSRTAEDPENLEEQLRDLARRHLRSVMRPQVLQLRRLVIGEAARFPALARTYYRRAPQRVLDALADLLRRLGERDLLRIADAQQAAEHFAFLVLGKPLDAAMFHGDDHGLGEDDLDRVADRGVRAFLAAYGPG